MTLIRKLALALCLALLCSSYSNAQVDSTTGNLINFTGTPTDTTSNWNNGVYVNQLGCFGGNTPGNCGPYPNVQTNGNINFSYGQVDLNQVVNINRALAAGGTGVQLSGFNFGFMAKNGNGWDNGQQDYLSAYVKFYNAGGGLAANYDYTSQTNQRYNWTQFNFSETFANPVAASNFGNAQVGFVGRDTNYWAGPYGPEINNVSFSLKYRVDPCATNPAYSPNCAGFNTVSTSNNLVPNRDGYAVFGDSINQSFAINTALSNAGSAAQIHGFQWGYTANANGPYCAFWVLVCFDERTPKVQTHVNITNSSGASVYSVSRNYENSYNDTNYSYLFPTSRPMSTLGNFNFSATTYDQAYVGSMYSRALFTADPCAVNPLSSPTCSGYGAAYAKLLSSTSTATSPSPALAPLPPALAEGAPASANPIPDPVQAQSSPSQPPPPPPPPVAESSQNPSVAQDNPSQPGPAQAGPASTTPQPAGGPPHATQTASSSSSSGPSASSAGPSKLAMSVLKSAQEKDKATQNAAVQAAAKTLEGSTQSSQASSNMAISMNQDMSANSATTAANFASQTTQASQQTTTQTSQPQQATQTSQQTTSQSNRMGPQAQQQQQDSQQASVQNTNIVQYQPQQQEQQQTQTQSSTSVVKLLPPQQQEQQQTQSQMTAGMMPPTTATYTPPQQESQSSQVTMLKPPTPPVVETQQQTNTGTGITVSRNLFAYNPLMSSNNSNQSMTQPQQQPMFQQQQIDQKQFEVETPQVPVASFGGGGKAGNPLSEIMMQQRFETTQNNTAQPTGSVNKNVQPNELAGGVDIVTMASVPAGFSAYSIVLKDSAFYEPKEVYKNQKTVDNERVLRGLTRGSDAKHQEMVNQQYKLGN